MGMASGAGATDIRGIALERVSVEGRGRKAVLPVLPLLHLPAPNRRSEARAVDLLAVQGTLKNLLQHHGLKVSVLQCSSFFMV